MDKEGEIQSVVLCEQFPQVECFVQYFTYYQSLLSCTKPFEDSNLRDLRDAVSDAFLGAAILAWYHVFAYSKSQIFWSKLIENMPEKVKQNFSKRIYKSTSLDKETYKQFLNNIKKLRDKYVAHRDLNW